MKIPYFKSLAGAVKANLQGGRGGACTSYYSIFDPEAFVITNLQNPRSPEDKSNRDIHFAMMSNRLFAKKVKDDKEIFSFTSFTAPDLVELFFSGDQDEFEYLYNKYENDQNFNKTYTSARKLLISCIQQGFEVGTLYLSFIDEMNRHSSFKDTIYSLNLCAEISQPTAPYFKMEDLYTPDYVGNITFTSVSDFSVGKSSKHTLEQKHKLDITDCNGNQKTIKAAELKVGDYIRNMCETVTNIDNLDKQPEVSLCSLAGIVVCNIEDDKDYEQACYYALKMVDKCIHKSDYVLPHVGFTAKQRLNAGIGVLGVAYSLAKKNLKYSSQEGRDEIHRIAERHAYYVIKGSLRLGQELGNAPWMHKTKWPEGWTPIKTYKRTVDEIAAPVYQYNWVELSDEIIANGGIRNSSLIAHAPTESSSKSSGVPNNMYPVRELAMKKSDAGNAIDWVAPDSDIIGDQYELAYDIPTVNLIKVYAIFQKFTDMAISADLYKDRSKDMALYTSDMIEEYLTMVKYGLKSRYYQISLTSKGSTQQKDTCGSGGCTL